MADPDIVRRNRAAKRAGAQWESDLIRWFRDRGYRTEGLRKAGVNDEGDIAVTLNDGSILLVEAKNTKRMDLAGWVGQAEREADNYARRREIPRDLVAWVVLAKRRNHGVADAYAISSLSEYLQ